MSKVILFSGIGYTNNMLELTEGYHTLPDNWKNKVESVKLSNNTRIRLYDNKTPSNNIEFTNSVPDLSISRWSNRAVRVHIEELSKKETFGNCMASNNIPVLILLILGVFLGLLICKMTSK